MDLLLPVWELGVEDQVDGIGLSKYQWRLGRHNGRPGWRAPPLSIVLRPSRALTHQRVGPGSSGDGDSLTASSATPQFGLQSKRISLPPATEISRSDWQ